MSLRSPVEKLLTGSAFICGRNETDEKRRRYEGQDV
jgi:hypothetical protein